MKCFVWNERVLRNSLFFSTKDQCVHCEGSDFFFRSTFVSLWFVLKCFCVKYTDICVYSVWSWKTLVDRKEEKIKYIEQLQKQNKKWKRC